MQTKWERLMRTAYTNNFEKLMKCARIHFDVTIRQPNVVDHVQGISHIDSAGVTFIVQRSVHGNLSTIQKHVDWDILDPILPDGLGRTFR